MSKNVTRLFKQFSPEHYDLHISLSEDKKSFEGSITIVGQRTGRPSKRLTFHQKGLRITNPKVTYTDKKKQRSDVPITRTVTHKSYDEVRLHSDQTLYPGAYEISLQFSGTITQNMDGVYPCNFTADGVAKQLIATQFESHHAREAFPCIDEPEAKATFQLTLTHNTDEVALSNTTEENQQANGTQTITTFKKTPRMSTYLLAFIVGELEAQEARSKRGVKIRAYAVAEHAKNTSFALKTAIACMDFYEDYYDVPFPLEKCDFVALPDFAAGAMENWGLITFREQLMIVDDHTSLHTKQYVAIVVAHELTHQWFGNLVTMRWWTDLWLNEGFASWMEYLAIDHLHPEWHLWTQFAVDDQQTALKADALEHTHPIEVPVKHPDEIRTIFDIISYQKGASVIHMLHDYLGADGFRDGLRHYLKTHAYGNTDTVDLWQALEDVTKQPVKAFMHTWTHKSGFPLLEVSHSNDHLKITQSIFVTNPRSEQRNTNTLWPVPLLSDDLEKPAIHTRTANVPLAASGTVPTKINSGQTGFYRVNYDHDMQRAQVRAIKDGSMSDIDRMGLLSDGFEVTRAGYQDIAEFLDLLQSYRAESSLPVWEIIASSLGSVRSVLSASDDDEQLRDLMKPFVLALIAGQLKRLGIEEQDNEPHLDTLLRPTIVSLAASADDPHTLDAIKQAFSEKVTHNTSLNPNLRGTIYSTIARTGGAKEYAQLLKLYESSSSADEKQSLAAGMTSFVQPAQHKQVLALIRSESLIKFQDVPHWVVYSFMNRHSRQATWEWLKDNWSWLKKNLGSDLSFSRFPLYAARTFSDETYERDYTAFFTAQMEPMIERTYQQGLEVIQTNTQWRNRDAKDAIDWFEKLKS